MEEMMEGEAREAMTKGGAKRETQSSARTKAYGANDGRRSQDGTRSLTARGDV